MDFKKLLDDYMKQLDCTAKDLAENSGLSAATMQPFTDPVTVSRKMDPKILTDL